MWKEPYHKGDRPYEPDGKTLHDCPAYHKDRGEPADDEERLQREAQKFVDEEQAKRNTNDAEFRSSDSDDKSESIKNMFDLKQALNKEFLAEKKRYNDLYERYVTMYEKYCTYVIERDKLVAGDL